MLCFNENAYFNYFNLLTLFYTVSVLCKQFQRETLSKVYATNLCLLFVLVN